MVLLTSLSGFYLISLSRVCLIINVDEVAFYPINYRVECYLINSNNKENPTYTDKAKPTLN